MPSRRSELRRSYSSNIDAAARHNSSLLFDFGTSFLRVGITGECKPRHVFVLPTCDQNKLSLSSPSFPYWSSIPPLPSRMLRHCNESLEYEGLGPWLCHLYNMLLIKPRSRRVIIILPYYHPPEMRNTLQSIFLDELKVPSILFTNTFCCVPYAIGSKTGMIVDIGCLEGRVVCYFNGRTCEDTLQIVPCGFQSLVFKINSEKKDISEDEVIDKIKEQEEDVGQMIYDTYFGGSQESLIYAFLSSIQNCPVDIRRQVLANVVFVGGGVDGIPHFERKFMKFVQAELFLKGDSTKEFVLKNDLLKKFSSLVPVIRSAPMRVLYPLEVLPSNAAWVGGSVMGAIGKSSNEWIKRDGIK